MTGRTWLSSYVFQEFLTLLGCKVEQSAQPNMVDIYNPKQGKVAVIPNSGYIPPEGVDDVIIRLGLVSEIRKLVRKIMEQKRKKQDAD